MPKKAVMVIAQRDFRDEELFHTKEELEKAGIAVTIASLKVGDCGGMLGGKARAAITIDEINPEIFNAIVFVGGTGANVFFENFTAKRLAKEFFAKGKIVAAICIAPSILANSGILKGKKATSYSSESSNLKLKGAEFTGKSLEVDGRIITASGPQAAREFGKRISEALK